ARGDEAPLSVEKRIWRGRPEQRQAQRGNHPAASFLSRGRQLNRPPQDQTPSARRAVSRSQSRGADGRQPVQQNVPFATGEGMTDPGDLVARAPAILTEEARTWRARPTAAPKFPAARGAPTPPSTRRPPPPVGFGP